MTVLLFIAAGGLGKVFDNANKVIVQCLSAALLVTVVMVCWPLLIRGKVGGIIVVIGMGILLGGMIVDPNSWWHLIKTTTNGLLQGA